jgi:hypothetical protein
VGVSSLVISSVDETPVSLALARSGTPSVAVGAVVSMTIALAPATLFAPDGTVVDVIALPAVSATVPIVKLETVRSAEVCPAATV